MNMGLAILWVWGSRDYTLKVSSSLAWKILVFPDFKRARTVCVGGIVVNIAAFQRGH